MNVLLVADGRVFEAGPDDYEPGDVAWFDEDILLVTAIKDGVAQAIEHPAAEQMMRAGLGEPGVRKGSTAAAMQVHAKTMARGWLAALDAGIIGGGRVGDDLHVFQIDEDHVVAVDEEDAKAVMRERCKWKPEDDAENFHDEPEEIDDDAKHQIGIEPIEKTTGEWARSHGRGWLSSGYT